MEKNGPLISVIVPVYDVEKYLSKCLDSLLAQTWRNLEIIVVDDGSPDGSWDIMQDYAARDSRVRIFRKKNGGVSAARNFGMDAAEGEYLGFVDPDDWVSPHYLEWMAEAMQEQGVSMALVDYLDVQEGDCEPEERLNDRPAARKITTERYPQTGREVGGNAWRMLCHRSVVEGLKKAFAVVEDGPQAMQDSVEARLLVACAHVYYRMESSPYADEALLKELGDEARRHRRLWWRLPNSNPREKGKVLMLLWFPSLGRGLWKLAKRIQKRT